MSVNNQKLLKENNLNPFETNKLYEFWVNSEYAQLPGKTIEQMIKVVVAAYNLKGKGFQQLFPARTMANDIHWAPMHIGGALVKRIAKWCKDNLDFKLSNDAKTALGTVMRQASLKDQTFYFDVVTKLQWKRGNFGDHDSCFLTEGGSRRDIPEHMEKDGKFAAIRFFKRLPNKLVSLQNDESKNIYYADADYHHVGYSRAFLCFDSYKAEGTSYYKGFTTDSTHPMIMVFNGYGYTTEQIGAITAQFLGYSNKKIGLTNNKSTSGGLYVNSDGVLLGDKSIIETIKSYDFGMKWREEKPSSNAGFKKDENLDSETAVNLAKAEKEKAVKEAGYVKNLSDKLKTLAPSYNPNIITRPIEGDNIFDDKKESVIDAQLAELVFDIQNLRDRELDRAREIDWRRHWNAEELEAMLGI